MVALSKWGITGNQIFLCLYVFDYGFIISKANDFEHNYVDIVNIQLVLCAIKNPVA